MRCGFHQVKAHWVLANEFADEQSGCHAFFTLEIEKATGTQCQTWLARRSGFSRLHSGRRRARFERWVSNAVAV
jgi:hypothetical protein